MFDRQVVQVIPEKPLASLAPCLVGRDGKPLVRSGMIDNQDLESYMSEEELLDDEDEADMSMLPQDVRPLLRVPVLFCFFLTYSFFFSTSFTGARKYDRNAPNKTPGREEEEPDSGDGDSEGNGRRNDSTDHGE